MSFRGVVEEGVEGKRSGMVEWDGWVELETGDRRVSSLLGNGKQTYCFSKGTWIQFVPFANATLSCVRCLTMPCEVPQIMEGVSREISSKPCGVSEDTPRENVHA